MEAYECDHEVEQREVYVIGATKEWIDSVCDVLRRENFYPIPVSAADDMSRHVPRLVDPSLLITMLQNGYGVLELLDAPVVVAQGDASRWMVYLKEQSDQINLSVADSIIAGNLMTLSCLAAQLALAGTKQHLAEILGSYLERELPLAAVAFFERTPEMPWHINARFPSDALCEVAFEKLDEFTKEPMVSAELTANQGKFLRLFSIKTFARGEVVMVVETSKRMAPNARQLVFDSLAFVSGAWERLQLRESVLNLMLYN